MLFDAADCQTYVRAAERALDEGDEVRIGATAVRPLGSRRTDAVLMSLPEGMTVDAAIGRLGRMPAVRYAERDWRDQKRGNETHASKTDPDARLARKSDGQSSILAYAGHVLMENRNGLLTLLKDAQHVLLLFWFLQLCLVIAESLVGLLIVRRWSFFKNTCLNALADCWKLRGHVWKERKRIAGFRQRSDFWMLRFYRLRLNRWEEVLRVWRYGLPKVEAR